MGKLTVIALQVEGDAAAISAACEVVRQELDKLVGTELIPSSSQPVRSGKHRQGRNKCTDCCFEWQGASSQHPTGAG